MCEPLSKRSQHDSKVISKPSQNDTKLTRNWANNDSKMISEYGLDSKTIPRWIQNDFKMSHNRFPWFGNEAKVIPTWSQNESKKWAPTLFPKWSQNDSKSNPVIIPMLPTSSNIHAAQRLQSSKTIPTFSREAILKLFQTDPSNNPNQGKPIQSDQIQFNTT